MADVKHMLVVEDEPLISMMLEDFLAVMDIAVAGTAVSVEEAVALVRVGQFDAAIVDVNLAGGERSDPVMELLAADGIPFIVSSGDPGKAPAGSTVLCKPFGLGDLEKAVAALGVPVA